MVNEVSFIGEENVFLLEGLCVVEGEVCVGWAFLVERVVAEVVPEG